MTTRILILSFAALILILLGQGFYQIFIQKKATPDDITASLKAVKFLTWRVGISLCLLVFILVTQWFKLHTQQ